MPQISRGHSGEALTGVSHDHAVSLQPNCPVFCPYSRQALADFAARMARVRLHGINRAASGSPCVGDIATITFSCNYSAFGHLRPGDWNVEHDPFPDSVNI